jgi:hypothetical protein
VQVGGLIGIVLYVLPGFVANETYKAFYPVRDRDQFPQLAWSVAVGLVRALLRYIGHIVGSLVPGLS